MSKLTPEQNKALRDYIVGNDALKSLASQGDDFSIAKVLREPASQAERVVPREELVTWAVKHVPADRVNAGHVGLIMSCESVDLRDRPVRLALEEATNQAGVQALRSLARVSVSVGETLCGRKVRHQDVSRALKPLRTDGKVVQL